MSDERISLDLLGARVLTLTAELRDLQPRFRVRVAERIEGTPRE